MAIQPQRGRPVEPKASAGPPSTSGPVKGSTWPLFLLTLRGIAASRRTIALAVVLLVPAIVTLLLYPDLDADYELFGSPPATDENAGRLWFEDSTVYLYFGLLVPLVTALYATGLIGDEVAAKTLPYLFTRPVRRANVFLSKFAAFAVATFALTAGGLIVTFFIALSRTQNPWTSLDLLAVALFALLLATLSFGALFALMGVGLPSPLVFAVTYFLLWENFVGLIPIPAKRVSILFYARTILFNHAQRTSPLDDFLGISVSSTTAILVLIGIPILFVAAAAFLVGRRDYGV